MTVEDSLAKKVSETTTKEGAVTTIRTTYDYDGVQFWIEARVDAVQTHNAEAAIRSAWGCEADIAADGTLRLRQ